MAVGERMMTFMQEVREEWGKITWPSNEDLKESTTVVIISVVILSIILGVVDKLIAIVMQQILKLS